MPEASDSSDSEVFAFVPSFNHAPFVGKSVRSIINQSLRPTKLLVIDDGSTDDSAKIIEKELNECPFEAELVVRENRGLSATLNQGLERSSGTYFAYLGSDDIWLPGFLRERARILKADPDSVLAFGHAFLIDENDTVIDCTADWGTYLHNGNALENLLIGIVPVTSGVVFRRAPLVRHGWNTNSILEDYELYLKLAVDGRFVSSEDILVCWRKHLFNVSNDFGKMMDEWLGAQNRVASQIGISAKKLTDYQRRLGFLSATNFLRIGEKRRAYELFRENWRGVRGPFEALELAGRLAMPGRVHKYLQEQRKRRQTKRYGKLTLGF